MKKKALAIFLSAVLLLAHTPAAFAHGTSYLPTLSIDGTAANCSIKILGSNTDEFSATLKLWRGRTCVATWSDSGTGYLRIGKTKNVTRGYTYKLTADVTINGEAQPQVEVSADGPATLTAPVTTEKAAHGKPAAACIHDYQALNRTSGIEKFDAQKHKKATYTTYLCRKCRETKVEKTWSAQAYTHKGSLYTASCNGTTQTHVYNCSVCSGSYTEQVTCSGAPHTGACRWLPA